MPVLVRIAFRNMWEHKGKSLIIGSLFVLGVLIIIIGNSMMDAASIGLKNQYIESFTGNVMVSAKSENTYSIFGADSMDLSGDMTIPTIPDYEKVRDHLLADPRVMSVASIATAYSLLSADQSVDVTDNNNQDDAIFAIVFGVDAASYFKTFPAITLEKGRLPSNGEKAVMITADMQKKLEKKYKRAFSMGDKILINGISADGMRIREVTLVGIYKRGDIGGAAPFIITDIDTVRSLAGLTMSADENIKATTEQSSLLSSDNPDDMFSGNDTGTTNASVAKIKNSALDNAASLLGDTSKMQTLNVTQSGAWHFMLIRLNNSLETNSVISDLNKWADSSKVEVRAADWKAAAGTMGKMADFIRIVFVIAILIIAIVAIIIIMNTLVISVIERTAEIGTMRALGAQRSFVRTMFLTETLTQTIIFGLIGAALAVTILSILNALHIPLTNNFAQLLLGGKFIHLVPTAASLVGTLIAVFLVGWLAHLYPVSIALKVQPVKAMQSE